MSAPRRCIVCGVTALYVRAGEGRCRKHRDIVTAAVREEQARCEAKSRDIAATQRDRDRRDALAELEVLGVAQPERVQVAFLAGYSHLQSKGLVNGLGALRSAGLIDYPGDGRVVLTPEGRVRANAPARPLSPRELQERVIRLLGGASGRILEPLIEAYPNPVDREELARRANYGHLQSKGFVNAIGRLRSLGFIDYPAPGQVVARPVLFLEAAS